MGNSDHGTTYMRIIGDDGELRPWHYIYVCPKFTRPPCVLLRHSLGRGCTPPKAASEKLSYVCHMSSNQHGRQGCTHGGRVGTHQVLSLRDKTPSIEGENLY